MTPRPQRLLDQVHDAVPVRHYAYSTEKTCVYWVKRFVLYHNKRHPMEMGEKEISEFLTHLAVEENVTALTQHQALSALLFPCPEVLRRNPGFAPRIVVDQETQTLIVIATVSETGNRSAATRGAATARSRCLGHLLVDSWVIGKRLISDIATGVC